MKRLLPFSLLLLLALPVWAADDLTARLDAIASSVFKPNEPGAAVLVVKDGRTLLRKGYGLADVELGVPIKPEHIFRIGSVTKQFTAVAVLQLVQQGKIALEDDITKHLPDAPTGGRRITIEHLLTHTSGIPSYTDQPAFPKRAREDMTPAQMLAMGAGVPVDFEPGAEWHYNNSGYILANANRLPTPQYVASRLAAETVGKPFPPKTITLAPETLDRYTGAYEITFDTDAAGKVTGLVLHQGGQDMPGKKVE